MRRTLLVGLALVVGAVLAVFISSWFDLELESVVLVGVALGAVIALVPDRSPLMRLAGFAGGFVAAWIGYFVRAALLPDSTGGRAVAIGLIIVLAVAIAAVSMERIPLWSTLVGAAAMAGAYEFTFDVAPPEVASTSVSTATALLLTVAIGYLAAALAVPAEGKPAGGVRRTSRPKNDDDETDRLDDMMMEKSK